MAWPLWVVRVYAEFLAREPMPEERTEIGIAQLSAMFGSVHRSPGQAGVRTADYLLFRDAWVDRDADDGYSDIDRELMRQLAR